jgi:diamine N-acetyltransferase
MSVSLREITPQNFQECISLKVADGQEKFVAPNLMSIAQSKVFPTMNISAVYDGNEMVGFVMFGLDPDDERYYLVRLMVDEKHQGKGYGKAATLEAINQLKQVEGCREVYLSFVPENTGAEGLYKSIGFERTGNISQGEVVMRFVIENNGNPKSEI